MRRIMVTRVSSGLCEQQEVVCRRDGDPPVGALAGEADGIAIGIAGAAEQASGAHRRMYEHDSRAVRGDALALRRQILAVAAAASANKGQEAVVVKARLCGGSEEVPCSLRVFALLGQGIREHDSRWGV